MIDAELFKRVMVHKPDPDAIHKRRTEMGLSLRELAAQMGCSSSFLCDIEKGLRSCSPEVAEKLSKVLRRR